MYALIPANIKALHPDKHLKINIMLFNQLLIVRTVTSKEITGSQLIWCYLSFDSRKHQGFAS